jgi:hypothetical protein
MLAERVLDFTGKHLEWVEAVHGFNPEGVRPDSSGVRREQPVKPDGARISAFFSGSAPAQKQGVIMWN